MDLKLFYDSKSINLRQQQAKYYPCLPYKCQFSFKMFLVNFCIITPQVSLEKHQEFLNGCNKTQQYPWKRNTSDRWKESY